MLRTSTINTNEKATPGEIMDDKIKTRLLYATIEAYGGIHEFLDALAEKVKNHEITEQIQHLAEVGDTMTGYPTSRDKIYRHYMNKAMQRAKRYDRRNKPEKADRYYKTVNNLLSRFMGSIPKGQENPNDIFDRLSVKLPAYYQKRTVENSAKHLYHPKHSRY